MKVENYTYLSHDDINTSIHAVKWLPEIEVKATLMIAHGVQEYIERYKEFGEYLTDLGYVVYGHDHIGHGDSVRDPKERGIMYTADPTGVMVEDMYTQYQEMINDYPDIPHFILGHSMGSYLLRRFLSDKADHLDTCDGAIIMGTGSENNTAIIAGKMFILLLAKLKGWNYYSKTVQNLCFGSSSYKGFNMDGSVPEDSWLSHNVESVKAYYQDPKDTFKVSLNGYWVLLETAADANNKNKINRIPKDLPLLVVSGDQDPVGGLGKGVKASYNYFKEAGIKDVTLKLYEGDRHELLQELDRQTVFKDLYDWMEAHAG